MGMLYEAVHPVLHTRVVIKTVLPTLAGEEAIADRFRNEALAASRIRDDRLPQILDIDRLDDGTQYMVMEFLEGEDLQRRAAAGAIDAGWAVRVIFEILEVLHKVHQIGIIHRDISPRNIFLARSDLLGEVPKLLDFGVAHFVGSPHTQPGEVLGSPFYMAPEQIHTGNPIGPWTDVFSAGVVLYELLSGTGVRPWPTVSLVDYLTAIAIRAAPRDLGEVAKEVPRALSDAVMRAIRFEGEERFQDAESFAQAIAPFAADRAMLYEPRRSNGGPGSRAPSAVGDAMMERSLTVGAALAMDATLALSSTARRTPLTARPLALSLSGVQAELAGMRCKPDPAPARACLCEGERRYLTVLLLNFQIEGSKEAALDGEDADQLSEQVAGLLERKLEACGGHVAPPFGGSLMATFGLEKVSEDDAEDAVSAALALLDHRREITAALAPIACSLRLRVGIHSGFVTRSRSLDRGRDEVLTGVSVVAAKMLEREAPQDGILVSRETLDLIGGRFAERPFGKLVQKARAEPLEAFEITGPASVEVQRWSRGSGAEAIGFVGREEPLAALCRVYQRALESAVAQSPTLPATPRREPPEVELCLVSGGAGIGKSRLLHEFLVRIGEDPDRWTRVFRAQPAKAAPYSVWAALLSRMLLLPSGTRCDAALAFGQLAALAVSLPPSQRAELLAADEIMAFLLSLGGQDVNEPSAPAELQLAIPQLLALCLDAISAPVPPVRPSIVVLDNVHRADSVSLTILGEVLGAMRAAVPPVVLLATRDADPALRLPENVNVTKIALAPLSGAEVSAMATRIAGRPLSRDAERLVVERAEGRPLFVEELVFALDGRGLTEADAAALGSFSIPTSLFGLILSGIDRIEPDLRATLQVISVLGVDFTAALFGAVAAALNDARVSEAQIEELQRQGLVARRRALGEEVIAFRQVLVRDAVYTTILRDNKRLLHKLAAASIERLHAGFLAAQLTSLFHHYSQTDEVPRIVHYARLYGRRAAFLGAFDDAVLALSMAEALRSRLAEDDPERAAWALLDLGSTLFWMGRLSDAAVQAEEAAALLSGEASGDRLTLRGRVHLLLSEIEYERARWIDALAHLDAAEELFLRADRPFEAAQARCSRGFQLGAQGRIAEGLALAREGWATLQRSNDVASIVRAGHDLGNILFDAGELEKAIEIFDRAIVAGEVLVRAGNASVALSRQLATRSSRAMTFAAMGRLDTAIADQRAIGALAAQAKNLVVQVSAGFSLARHLVEKGSLDDAEATALGVLQLCSSLGMPAREAKCRVFLAEITARRLALQEGRD
jgi:class 3 adenylate cyclase/tetratricopeptide (TPR) repeat protein